MAPFSGEGAAMQRGFWRCCRVGCRWLRRVALVLILMVLGALAWLNRVGLPDFLKLQLVAALRERGVELQFDRLRLSFTRGLLADHVRVGPAGAGDRAAFFADRVRLDLNYPALLHRRLQLDGVMVRRGRFTLPLSSTNLLALQNVEMELHFLSNDTWSFDRFQASLAGLQLQLAGEIAHAPELRRWELFHQPHAGASAAREPLKWASEWLQQIQLEGQPELNLKVLGDGRDVHSFSARLRVNAPGIHTPWGGARNLQLAASLTAPADAPTNREPSWAWWNYLQPFRVVWSVQLAQLKSEKLNADFVACAGVWRAPELLLTNLSARLGGGTLQARAALNVATREFSFTNQAHCDVHAVAALLSRKTRARLAEFSWRVPPLLQAGGSLVLPAWTNRHPDLRAEVQPTIRLCGALALTNAAMNGVPFDFAHTHFSYSHLVWRLPDLELAQGRTQLAADGEENDASRRYRWHVRGRLAAATLQSLLTSPKAVRVFSHFTFAEPLHLNAEIAGRLYDYDSIGACGRAALTNFTIRGEAVDSVTGEFAYTNRVLVFFHPRLWRGAQTMTADAIRVDFNTRLISFTNGFSTADPLAVARAIGPRTGEILAPYQFPIPPPVFVKGQAPLRDVNGVEDVGDADLWFELAEGVPFQCLKFRSPRLTGTVHWLGQTLVLTNVVADLYGGRGSGFAVFDFGAPHQGADFQFQATMTNVNLHVLASDLASPANHLEGALSGRVVVTRGDTRDWRMVEGYGHAHLRDGLLWDIPVFGILSPVLNAISPGLGNSRATDASADFTMTNGVIHSDSLQINTATTRLQYVGTVDLQGNLDAHVTAQLLHNVPGVGPLLSTLFYPVTKLFEFKITGTLQHPRREPVYVPKFLLMPLHPIRSLEELFSGAGQFFNFTNAPPAR
ncbi:MAG TPA: AsmA-like C-terminal region-containing protein [Verrucomicrobiae bacterium]|nr:AsmA-like C-terminal region-containing protein [Verrucomicrobiae bacterium]